MIKSSSTSKLAHKQKIKAEEHIQKLTHHISELRNR